MKRALGILLLLIGMFVLGVSVRRLLGSKTEIISPVPHLDTIRVIRLTPTPSTR